MNTETSDTISHLEAIKAQIAVMGANDSEFSDLAIIQNKFLTGEISPTKAVEKAEKIRDNKQDYH